MRSTALEFVKQFFTWWGSELFGLLPVSWKRELCGPKNILLLQMLPEGMHAIWVNDDVSVDLGLFPLNEEGNSAFLEKTTEIPAINKAKCILVLTSEQCIDRSVSLPKEAASNFREVMSFELDRYTPFSKENGCFDVIRAGADVGHNKIAVHLAVTSRSLLENLLKELLVFKLLPTTASFSTSLKLPLEGSHFNLLPNDMRPETDKKGPLIMGGLLAFLLFEVMVILSYPGWRSEQEVADLQRKITAIQGEVRIVSGIRSDIEKIRTQVANLLEQADHKPYVVDIMKELTVRLPTNTWLTKLQLTGSRMHIQGYSREAARLIQLLDNSQLFENTRFSSPLASNKSAQQAFKIRLDVVHGRANVSAANE